MPRQKFPTAISLFTGVGGFDLGVRKAGFRIISGVEIDPKHVAAYTLNFPSSNIILDDIANMTQRQSYPLLNGRDSVDLVFGGSPCQGFSVGGKRDPNDPRNNLALQFLKVVQQIQPKYFLFENVPGMLMGEQRQRFIEFRDTALRMAYTVHYVVVNTNQFEVAQNRNRLFILGSKRSVKPLRLNSKEFVGKRVTVSDAIGDIYKTPAVFNNWKDVPFFNRGDYAKYLDSVFSNRKSENKLYNHLMSRHSVKVTQRFQEVAQGHRDKVSRFVRLSPNGLSPTLRAGTTRANGSHTAPRPIHPLFNRCITPREAARLHSYPDWFIFDDTIHYSLMQIGNSVAPLQAYRIAQKITELL